MRFRFTLVIARALCYNFFTMKYKLIISDFDDTILDGNGRYSDYFVSTVRDFVARGGHFHIATGRMTSGVIDHARDMGLKGDVITFQGSVVADIESGEILVNDGFSPEVAVRITRYLEALGCYFHVYSHTAVITKKSTRFTELYSGFSKCDIIETGSDVSDYIEKTSHVSPKIMAMSDPENIPSLMARLQEEFKDVALVNTSKKWMVEIVPLGIDKGVAAARLAKKLGIPREETLCIGDSLNDAPMIRWAGLGVVVANGSDEAKSYADVIAPSSDDEGVAKTILEYGI